MDRKNYSDNIRKERISKDEFLKNSPVMNNASDSFSGLNYFDPDISYRFELELLEFPVKEPIIIKDSKGNDRHFLKWGRFEFVIDGILNHLNAYKSNAGETRLFVPFKDATTAKETYGAGRYIDLEDEHDKVNGKWILDFNLAYNPYCAYSHNYSCPLVPVENILKVEILAGEKKLK